jgi:hypothetical protein
VPFFENPKPGFRTSPHRTKTPLRLGTNPAPRHFTNIARGKRRVSKADEYQRLAAECLLLAKTASNQTNRAVLLQMAATWLNLAEHEFKAVAQHTEVQDSV